METESVQEVNLNNVSTGDLQQYTEGPFGTGGTYRYRVAVTGTAATINPGEPVITQLGTSGTAVATMATNGPLAASTNLVGVSQSVSTETATLAGVVDVYDIFAEDVSFLITPNVLATWNTQALYNALVGSRILLDKTNGVYTALATDSSVNGCVVLPLDVPKYPGKVRIAFRKGCNYLA